MSYGALRHARTKRIAGSSFMQVNENAYAVAEKFANIFGNAD